MKYNEIYERYMNMVENDKKRQNEICKLQKRINRLKEQPKASWIIDVLQPLANELKNRFGKAQYKLWGPFGLNCDVSIVLYDNDDEEEGHIHLHLRPVFDYENNSHWLAYLKYWTHEYSHKYQKGSLADLNGGNMIMAKLPEDIDAIVDIFRELQEKDRLESEQIAASSKENA
jgi:hypothetical protein